MQFSAGCYDLKQIGRELQPFVLVNKPVLMFSKTFYETLHNFVSLLFSSFWKLEIFALWYDFFIAFPMRSHDNFAQCNSLLLSGPY
jgi:hypothetical protein